jgi:hypothetical protein
MLVVKVDVWGWRLPIWLAGSNRISGRTANYSALLHCTKAICVDVGLPLLRLPQISNLLKQSRLTYLLGVYPRL